jgi:hypothetical protein
MKLRNIIPALFAGLTILTGCKEDEATYLDSVRVSQSIVSLPVEGGEASIAVDAKSEWTLKDVPAWLKTTINATNDSIKFSAEATPSTREATLKLMCAGDSQYIKVMQSYGKVELPI